MITLQEMAVYMVHKLKDLFWELFEAEYTYTLGKTIIFNVKRAPQSKKLLVTQYE